jgi:hypothetical protein
MAEMTGTDGWRGLIAETRQALAALRVDELEALAARAEAMLAECGVASTVEAEERAGLAAEHRLLGDLLRATDGNLAVLRRLGFGAGAGGRAEGGRRWVR